MSEECRAWQDPYQIDAKIEDARDGDAPVLRLTGTTNLPDEAVLTMHVYYGRVELGKHLFYRAVKVEKGAFAMDFKVYAAENLPGRHLIQVRFNPYTQAGSVTGAMKEDLRAYETTAQLVIGTEKQIDEARIRVHGRLAEEIKRLDAIAGEIRAGFEKNLQKRDAQTWNNDCAAWEREIREIQKRAYNVPEYRALDIADISESVLEQIARGAEHLMEGCSAALTGKTRDPKIFDAVDGQRKLVTRIARQCLLRLGLETGSADELRGEVEGLVKFLARALDMLPVVSGRGGHPEFAIGDPEQYRREFQKWIFRLNRIAPPELREAVSALARAGNEVCRLLSEAARTGKEETEAMQKAVAAVDDAAAAFLQALDKLKGEDR